MRKTHRFRAIRNLLIIALLLALLWFLEGFPMPTLAMEMHRAERQRIAEESKILWRYDGTQPGDKDILVGVTADAVHTYVKGRSLKIWPRSGEKSTLVLLPERTRYYNMGSFLDPAFLAIDPPAQAQTARLTVTYLDETGVQLVYAVQGQRQEGVFFFQLERQYRYAEDERQEAEERFFDSLFSLMFMEPKEWEWYSYTLEFLDAGGESLQTISNAAS